MAGCHVDLIHDGNENESSEQDTDLDDDINEDDAQEPDTVPCRTLKWLCIGDCKAVENFYRSRFCAMRQASCVTVAKLWIRVIHPGKQSQNPYSGVNAKRPKWWSRHVVHREPHQIKKPGDISR